MQLIPTNVFVEALLAAFQHLGNDLDTTFQNTKLTDDSSIIPMIPSGELFEASCITCISTFACSLAVIPRMPCFFSLRVLLVRFLLHANCTGHGCDPPAF